MPSLSPRIILAELSVTPIGSETTSVGKQVSEAIKAIKNIEGLRCETNAMGTVLQSEKLETILEAVKVAHEAIFKSGEKRVVSVLRIDDRRDKTGTIESKVRSVTS